MRVLSFLLAITVPLPVLAQTKTEYPALRQRLQRGNYAEARAGYEPLTKAEKPAPAAILGLAACDRAEGKHSESFQVLDRGLKALPDNPDLLAQRADLLFFLGKWDEAVKDADAAIKKQEGNFLAHWVRARLLRDQGNLDEAKKELSWIVKAYNAASDAGKDIADSDRLLIVGQAGAEYARLNNKPHQYEFILNEVYKDALKADPDGWQTENLAGRLLAEKHNLAQAAEAFDKALTINPKGVAALVGKGQMLLDDLDTAGAGRLAEQALAVNPNDPEALRLKADVRLAEGDAASAERLLLAAKLVNRRDERTLARLAALRYLARKPMAIEEAAAEVLEFCKSPGVFYSDLADGLASRKQFDAAEECYKKAMERRKDLSAPRAGLGLLYMQLGRESDARTLLKAARDADPFHVRVSNAIKVLDHLAGYAVRETPHFTIKYDPRIDAVQAAFAADYLEQLHARFSKLYGYSPPGKTLVEFMTTHEIFSGRITSLPGLPGAAQGASTGPLIAIPSPHGPGGKLFNWGVVVRHELTHSFNLTQTGYLVPIWLTEGLAVRAEGTRRFDATAPLLRDRLAAGSAFDLDSIGHGYHNFGNPADVMLAYHQGYLYVEYIISTYGEESIAKLLQEYRLGLDTGDAIRRACGVEKTAFEAGYREFLRGVVKGIPRPPKPMKFAELEAANKKDPDDAGIAARLADEYVRRNMYMQAGKLVDGVLAKEKGHPQASMLKARLLQREKDIPGAVEVLEAAAKVNPDDARVMRKLGELYVAINEPDKAAEAFEALRLIGSAEPEILLTLVKLYTTSKKSAALVDVLADVTARFPDDLDSFLMLAKLHQEAGQFGKAEAAAREALFVDVLNSEALRLLLAALRAQKRDAEAEEIEKRYKK